MEGDVLINGKDAYVEYGINFEDGAIANLMTPPSLKDIVSNSSRLQHGRRYVVGEPKYEERALDLPFHLIAEDSEDFFIKYNKFCKDVLAKGEFTLRSILIPDREFRLIYNSCSSFSETMREMALFNLKVTEPDPTNNYIDDSSDD